MRSVWLSNVAAVSPVDASQTLRRPSPPAEAMRGGRLDEGGAVEVEDVDVGGSQRTLSTLLVWPSRVRRQL